ncbi:MAG: D-alanine--D-alanine ligase [Bacteroidales bacterium]|nr:MAG: D-alanine--D-alanine ligase [Bacteroidales bacterium]
MKINVAIVAGGNSSEYQISVNSAGQVLKHLDKKRYNTHIILVRGNNWTLQHDHMGDIQVNKNDFSCIINGRKLTFDVVFIAIHGTPGEDGKLQSYFDLTGIPYTGSGAFTSCLTFNKYACKVFLMNFGIATAKAKLFRKRDYHRQKKEELGLRFPCFVKPNNSGSSFGVSRIDRAGDLPGAVNKAFEEDDEVIVEEFIDGTEITCGIFKTGNESTIFPLTEIVSRKEFFDFEAKYTAGMADEITPARIPEPLAEKCKNISSLVYDALNCRGIVRIDYILSGKKLYFLEINTVPGMSAESIIPKQVIASGMSLTDLYGTIIEDALPAGKP